LRLRVGLTANSNERYHRQGWHSVRIEGFSLAPIATTERDNICALQERKVAFDATPIR
jgi:hypothetical protein